MFKEIGRFLEVTLSDGAGYQIDVNFETEKVRVFKDPTTEEELRAFLDAKPVAVGTWDDKASRVLNRSGAIGDSDFDLVERTIAEDRSLDRKEMN
jgi:hypothetical protein